jgi:hypothetical protein
MIEAYTNSHHLFRESDSGRNYLNGDPQDGQAKELSK